MQKRVYLVVVLALGVAMLAACGGGAGSGGTGSTGAETPGAGPAAASPAAQSTVATGGSATGADNGKAIFARTAIGSAPGCITCHSLDGSKLVGPSMQGIGTRAASEVSGQSAEQYLKQSIVAPNEHVVEGYVQGVMPSFEGVLQDAEVNDLVAYLMTLK